MNVPFLSLCCSRRPILVGLSFLWLVTSVSSEIRAAENPYGISPEHDDILRRGFHELFSLQFDAAEKTLAPLKEHADIHPIFRLADVIRHWWYLSVHVLEVDEEKSRAFMKVAEDTLKGTDSRATDEDKNGEAHLVMGTTLGLMSRWSAANRAWLPAYLRGKKSARYLKRTIEINPGATDAFMTLGAFNYAREMLRKKSDVKKGKAEPAEEPDLGLTQLRTAYTSAPYFNEAAGLMLAGILANTRPQEALPLIAELRTALPANTVLHMLQITALYNAGRRDEMKVELENFQASVASGAYSDAYRPQSLFAEGLWALGEKNWTTAADYFGQAVACSSEETPYHAWSLLYQGYAYDAMKDRTNAKKNYRAVLALRRRYASHDHAQYRLYMPFLATDTETRKLEL